MSTVVFLDMKNKYWSLGTVLKRLRQWCGLWCKAPWAYTTCTRDCFITRQIAHIDNMVNTLKAIWSTKLIMLQFYGKLSQSTGIYHIYHNISIRDTIRRLYSCWKTAIAVEKLLKRDHSFESDVAPNHLTFKSSDYHFPSPTIWTMAIWQVYSITTRCLLQ